jgi:hypothetical protein
MPRSHPTPDLGAPPRELHDPTANVIVPPRLVVSTTTAEHLVRRMEKPRRPTPALRALFAKK